MVLRKVGGAHYTQATEPVNPSNAEQWVDTSETPFVLKMYNSGTSSWDILASLSELQNHTSAGNPHTDSASVTELNNHANNSSAHHIPPTETNDTGISGGYDSNYATNNVSYTGNAQTTNTFTFNVKQVSADGVRFDYSGWNTSNNNSNTIQEVVMTDTDVNETIIFSGSDSITEGDSREYTFSEAVIDSFEITYYAEGPTNGAIGLDSVPHKMALPTHSHTL
jgi:hypothetical protein